MRSPAELRCFRATSWGRDDVTGVAVSAHSVVRFALSEVHGLGASSVTVPCSTVFYEVAWCHQASLN
ncbi:hypothetical protein NDU88_002224 [Pleurodeles waltl]|uniref:Uncharacterized protein n=1 Tax=Pleurodeles waltl TaxID=8319 RepID=A0AAV7LBS0_PLEWA|nr:hypothetical protein NDU88_002224 [Pleurodeles waltl]